MRQKHRGFFQFKHARTGIALQVAAYLFALGGFGLMAVASGRENFPLSLLALGFFFLSPFLYRTARRLRSRIITDVPGFLGYLDSSKRRLVLYLREFASDAAATHASENNDLTDLTVTDEERIVGVLRSYGLVVAIGKPGERLPPGGWLSSVCSGQRLEEAGRGSDRTVRHYRVSLWQDGRLRWELGKIAEKGKLTRTVFVSSDPESNVGIYRDLRQLGTVRSPESTRSAQVAFEHLRETVRETEGRLPADFPRLTQERLAEIENTVRTLEAVGRGLELIGVSHVASVFLLADGDVKELTRPLDRALPQAMDLIGLKPTSKGLIDPEIGWQPENVIAVLVVITAAMSLLLPVVVFVLPPLFEQVGFVSASGFIKTNFVYFLFAWLALFFLIVILRP
jgi:hypothetical protein